MTSGNGRQISGYTDGSNCSAFNRYLRRYQDSVRHGSGRPTFCTRANYGLEVLVVIKD